MRGRLGPFDGASDGSFSSPSAAPVGTVSGSELGYPEGEGRAHLLVVDDHPAVRAGLVALLEDESALTLLPAAAGAEEALVLARRQAPEIAVLDVALEDGDGLRLCLDLKRLPAPPAVLLYTASADPLLGLKARLVGADGLIDKAARANELSGAIEAVLQGEVRVPAFNRELLKAKAEHLSPEALAVVGLRLESTPIGGIAEVLGLNEDEVITRISGLLRVLDGDSLSENGASSLGTSPWSGGLRPFTDRH